jgi:hypothetical protein
MSLETSTSRKDAKRKAAPDAQRPQIDAAPGAAAPIDPSGFQPWHLFAIATLFASSAAAFAVRGTSPANVVFVCLTVLTAGVAAYAVYRTLSPLVEPERIEVPEMLGGRTRAALEREKTLVLRAIKELEFDRAMGKVSEADWQEMTGRLRARAVRLIRQLDSGSAVYRDLIEKELAARAASGRGAAANGAKPAAGAAVILALVAGSLLTAAPATAQMGGMGGSGMPDAKAMSGIPRPSETVPAGSVSVRLVRGQISNLIVDAPVVFDVDGRRQTVKTDASGHAVVAGLAAGAAVKVSAMVDGERLDSQPFQASAQTGIVLMLVASEKTAQQQLAKDAVPGTVVLGNQSRVVVQFDDEELQVFYLLDIVNASAVPVITAPLVVETPDGALNTAVLEGSSPTAVAKGRRVTVSGPFAPGSTTVQIGFQLPPGDTARVRFALPADFPQPTVIVEKAGAMTLASAQLPTVREANDGGRQFVMGVGAGLKTGQVFAFDVVGVPHHPTWPRNLALGLAVLILAAGLWFAIGTGRNSGEQAARAVLERRREAIFADLLRIDRGGAPGQEAAPETVAKRVALVAELEKIYGELDAESAGGRADQGFAA